MRLYKYMPAKRALQCLPENGDGTIRATPPIALNDPYESFVRTLHRDREQDLSDAQLSSLLGSICSEKPVDATMIGRARSKYESNYLRELFARQLSYRYGIVSFSADPFHPLMWSHYACDGSGFVVGYDADRVREALPSEEMRPVRYISKPVLWDYPAVQLFGSLALTILCCKSCHWKYEQEWRLVVELKGTVRSGSERRHGTSIPVDLVHIPNEAVERVYFTERTPLDVVDCIDGRLRKGKNRYVNARLRKLVLSQDAFKYGQIVN